jgi:alkylhydroperoxidase family enzyme
MTTRIPPAPAEQVAQDPELAGILGAMREGWWADSAWAAVVGRRPATLKAVVGLIDAVYTQCDVDPLTLELMRIRTAQTRDDKYGCTVRVQLLAEAVAAVGAGADDGGTDDGGVRRELALEVAERMALNPHTVDDEFFAALRAEFTDREIVALIFAASTFNLASAVAIALHLDTDPGGLYPTGLVYRQNRLHA